MNANYTVYELPAIGSVDLSRGDDSTGAPKSDITLEYFEDFYARCDPIRFLLHHAKVDFKYVGHTQAAWGKIKAEGKNGEFGGLPRAYINGEEMGQSMAILRMFGAQYGYYPTDNWKTSFYINVILDCWGDMMEKANGLAFGLGNMSEEEKETKTKEMIDKAHIPALNCMEMQLGEHGGPYIAGAKLTIADCALVANLVNTWENPAGPYSEAFKPVLAKYPKVQAYNLKLREAFKDRLNDPERKPKMM